ncbi:hypothetical protein [Adhaeribacter rhizoryzae]|uniref:Uncharacterized protein n=1 Tax=Adhaeribacter rhizoryzae TaxID=2607907 RepID=A0A5M6DNQ9_9BACT|nr:hypothetical protein [Adhaeribacter rhizoryzae]KAA5547820.1 hypothetical protein F0145_07720 [Adhaeribacter rhizoryzae]
MPIKTTMTGFDMVWAITQNTVNSQLDWLSGQTIPTQVSIGDINNDAGAIQGGIIGPPTVNFATGEPHLAYLYLKFKEGIFSYWSGHGRNQIIKQVHINGWILAFSVHLNIAQFAQDYVKDSKAVPPEILDKLTKFDDTMFSIQSIFLDFENSDLSTYNDLQSDIPITADASGAPISISEANQIRDTFNGMLRVWLLNHKGTDNPFILGYSVTAKQTSDDVKAVLNPTGANFSTHGYEYPGNLNDSSKDGLSTFNFLMVTGNRNILGDPTLMRADSGSFHKNLVESNDIDGKAIIAKEVFFEKYLWDLVVKPFQDKVLTLGDYAHARDDARNGQSDFTEEINDKTHTFLPDDDGLGWHYGDHVKLSWKEKGGETYHHQRESEQNLQFKVRVGTAPDPRPEMMGAPRLTLTITGSVYRYEWDQVDQYFGKLGDSYLGKGWASAAIAYTITIQFVAGTDGKISIFHTSLQSDPVTTSDTGGVYNIADIFTSLLNLHTIADDWSNNATSLANVNKDVAQQLIDATGPILDSAMTKVILPGRNEFFYKNIQLNTDEDVEIDLQYKTT